MWQVTAALQLAQAGFHRGIQFLAVTSQPTPAYNCIAWAAGDVSRWWWPNGGYFWPGLPAGEQRLPTRDEFVNTFATLGYQLAASAALEPNTRKIALYEHNGLVTHAARQLPSGNWTSKCGRLADVEHTLEQLQGPQYGGVTVILAKAD